MGDRGVTDVVTTARTGVVVDDWRAAVGAACGLLVDTGAVLPAYARACVTTIEANGPYVVVAPGIALAHARPEDGAHVLALGVAVLDRPVAFGHDRNDPVDVVFAFGSPDRDRHVGLVAALSRALGRGLAQRLRDAPTDRAAQRLLREVVDDVR